MKTELILFKLKIKSSYNQNIEIPADDTFDTLQFYIQDKIILRIKTYAMDHDIHIHAINLRDKTVDEMIEFLITSTNDHYEDVVEKMIRLEIDDPKNYEEIKAKLMKEGLSPYLDTPNDFLFWNPDNKKYKTQSKPL